MKVRFYCDVYAFSDPHWLSASANPIHTKQDGCTRIAFDVEIPDGIIHAADVVLPHTSYALTEEDNNKSAAE